MCHCWIALHTLYNLNGGWAYCEAITCQIQHVKFISGYDVIVFRTILMDKKHFSWPVTGHSICLEHSWQIQGGGSGWSGADNCAHYRFGMLKYYYLKSSHLQVVHKLHCHPVHDQCVVRKRPLFHCSFTPST